MAAPRKYPDELRERAVRLAQESGRPIAHVADDLGVHREALRGWVRQAEADRGQRPDLLSTAELSTAEREEHNRLRAEVGELRRANEIWKAASVAAHDRPHDDSEDYADLGAKRPALPGSLAPS